MGEKDELLVEARRVIQDLCKALITVEPRLTSPYEDMPELNSWDRFIKRPFRDAARIEYRIGEVLRREP